jgi:hypothetical protein
VIIGDASGLFALYDEGDPDHRAVRDILERTDEPIILSPYVVAELDYLVATRVGVEAELATIRELAGGGYVLADLDARDLGSVVSVIERYRDQAIGVADASIVVLADRFRTKSILTLDRRHFEILRPLQGGRFKILPGPQ